MMLSYSPDDMAIVMLVQRGVTSTTNSTAMVSEKDRIHSRVKVDCLLVVFILVFIHNFIPGCVSIST